jgi:hypothetical protein
MAHGHWRTPATFADRRWLEVIPRVLSRYLESHCSCLSRSDDTPFNFNLSRFTHGLLKLVLLPPYLFSDGRRVIQRHSPFTFRGNGIADRPCFPYQRRVVRAIRLLQSPVHCCGDWALLNRRFSHSLLQYPPTWATHFPFIFVVSPADRSHDTLAL